MDLHNAIFVPTQNVRLSIKRSRYLSHISIIISAKKTATQRQEREREREGVTSKSYIFPRVQSHQKFIRLDYGRKSALFIMRLNVVSHWERV